MALGSLRASIERCLIGNPAAAIHGIGISQNHQRSNHKKIRDNKYNKSESTGEWEELRTSSSSSHQTASPDRVVGGEVGVVFSIAVPHSGQGADITRARQARFRDEELRLAGFCYGKRFLLPSNQISSCCNFCTMIPINIKKIYTHGSSMNMPSIG
jgi:hypothetical protein